MESFVNVIHATYTYQYPYTDIISMNFTRDVHASHRCTMFSKKEHIWLRGSRYNTQHLHTSNVIKWKSNGTKSKEISSTVALLSKRSLSSRIVVNISHIRNEISYAWEDIYLALDSRQLSFSGSNRNSSRVNNKVRSFRPWISNVDLFFILREIIFLSFKYIDDTLMWLLYEWMLIVQIYHLQR